MQGSVNTCNSVHLKTQLIDGYVIVQTKNRQIQVKSTFHLGLFVGPVHNVGANHRLLKSTHTHTYKSTHIFYVIHTLKLWLWPTEKAAILSYFHMQTQHRHTHSNHNTWSNNRQWQHSPREFIHITRTTSTDEGFSFYPNKWQKPRKKDQYTEKQRSHLSSSQYRQTTAQKLTTVYIYIYVATSTRQRQGQEWWRRHHNKCWTVVTETVMPLSEIGTVPIFWRCAAT